jgi:hypothetical protein
MARLKASRPFMPGYGILGPDEGTGLLPWSWVVGRLDESEHYWVATVSADGAPHVSPVWGTWHGGAVWFSCSTESRKARDLHGNARCVVTSENALEPVVVEGEAERRTGPSDAKVFAERMNRKYETEYPAEFFAQNALFRVEPTRVIGLVTSDFSGSPTRWVPE